ncbi:50S ribosomal protein L9 [Aerosakkonemataceae cyanobacterium BLCC-F50]|uniref:Large ribosomal subunit protein bL9 n=1 Tax=Floridaenema flaviceps BLCC-F50 TaxID=3153642 RepID=A0ABV4XXC6_9CYAN
MSKRVQLVLLQDVNKLGRSGDVVDVAPGYARNYLIPRQFATHVTPGILKQVERRREQERQRLAELKEQALAIKTAIERVGNFTVREQAGEGDAIFGSVTNKEVAQIIQQVTGHEVDRRGITLPEIRKTGTYKAEVKIHPEVSAQIEIIVLGTAS